MAYKKEYPVLNDSGAGSLEEYTKRQEDRIESGFKDVEKWVDDNYRGTVYVSGKVDLGKWTGNGAVFASDGFEGAPVDSYGYGFVESMRLDVRGRIYTFQRFNTLDNRTYTRVYTTGNGKFTAWKRLD